jgi:hypothetical protein
MVDALHRIGNISTSIEYRTSEVLQTGAQIPGSRSIVVGRNESGDTSKAAILLGAVCELTTAKSFMNWGVWLDAEFPHVMLIVGKRGSGKSYDLGIIAEALCAKEGSKISYGTERFAMILFDTQSQFWTLAQGESLSEEQKNILGRWEIPAEPINEPTIYRPKGTPKIGENEVEFALRPGDLSPSDWAALCELEQFSPMGQCLYKARFAMSEGFGLQQMIDWLQSDDAMEDHVEGTRLGVKWRLEAQQSTNLFDETADDICARLGTVGAKGVIQLADLEEAVKAVIVAVIMRKLISWAGPAQRRRKMAEMQGIQVDISDEEVAPRIWTLIDEAHLICPSQGHTAARPVVVDYVKRGRDAGLSLVLATQQPSAIDTDAISQADIVVIHKLTIDPDINAAVARMPAPGPKGVQKGQTGGSMSEMSAVTRTLESSQSLFADAESNRAFIMRSRPRVTPHGGGEPSL